MQLLRIIQWCAVSNTRAALEEEAGELSRYRADVVAALTPLSVGALCGAVAGVLVFLVPVAVVGGSMLLLNLTFNFGIVPLRLMVRLFQLRIPRAAVSPADSVLITPIARPTQVAPLPAEGPLPGEGDPVGVVLVLLFWPLVLLGIGAVAAWLYRVRRRRRLEELRGAPVEVAVFPEIALFYGLTATAGLAIGVGSFVALGANAIFAWAGYLIWRWLFDRFVWRAAPATVKEEAMGLVAKERGYRRRVREEG